MQVSGATPSFQMSSSSSCNCRKLSYYKTANCDMYPLNVHLPDDWAWGYGEREALMCDPHDALLLVRACLKMQRHVGPLFSQEPPMKPCDKKQPFYLEQETIGARCADEADSMSTNDVHTLRTHKFDCAFRAVVLLQCLRTTRQLQSQCLQ